MYLNRYRVTEDFLCNSTLVHSLTIQMNAHWVFKEFELLCVTLHDFQLFVALTA